VPERLTVKFATRIAAGLFRYFHLCAYCRGIIMN